MLQATRVKKKIKNILGILLWETLMGIHTGWECIQGGGLYREGVYMGVLV